jgi:hypothetical protein
MFGRDEKNSPNRLTVVQYIILAIFLILAYGLWLVIWLKKTVSSGSCANGPAAETKR